MDVMKIGQFIAALRKASGLTQQEVADRLGVTDKTISKWECGKGLPDISALPAIAELFGVTTDEILRGERIMETVQTGKAQSKTIEQAAFFISSKCGHIRNLLCVALGGTICGFIVLFILLNTSYSGPISCGVSLILCTVSAILWVYVFLEIKEIKQNKTVLQYQGKASQNQIQAVMKFSRIVIFLLLYAVTLNLSLLFASMQYGGDLPLIDRENFLHYWIALIIAIAGAYLYTKMMED